MRVTATILLTSALIGREVAWDSLIDKKPILDRVIENCLQSGIIDDLALVTDQAELVESKTYNGLPVKKIPQDMQGHLFNFVTYETRLIFMERYCLDRIGMQGDVHIFMRWNLALLQPRSIERMYHALLDDRIAARIVPIFPVDPHLYMKLSENGAFFPVWSARGMDRQSIPQLFRPGGMCIEHCHRIKKTIPHIIGYRLPRWEVLSIETSDDLELAEFIYQRSMVK